MAIVYAHTCALHTLTHPNDRDSCTGAYQLSFSYMHVCTSVHTHTIGWGEQNRDLQVIHICNYKMGSLRIPDTHVLAFGYYYPMTSNPHF